MKREKTQYPLIKPFKSLFWKTCRFCNKEFKREDGFIITDYTKINPSLYDSYCCNDCCKTIEEVKNKIKEKELNFKLLMEDEKPPIQHPIKKQDDNKLQGTLEEIIDANWEGWSMGWKVNGQDIQDFLKQNRGKEIEIKVLT